MSFCLLALTVGISKAQPNDTLLHAPFNLPDGTVQGPGNPPKWARNTSSANLAPPFAHLEVKQNGFEAKRINGEASLILDTVDASSGPPARAIFYAEGTELHSSDSILFEIKGENGGWYTYEKRGGSFSLDTIRSPFFNEKVLLRATVKHGMQGGGPNLERTHRVELAK
ncbi:MAG: hypothetical protein ABEH38_06720, partial [Flavobacteriales bacterium]